MAGREKGTQSNIVALAPSDARQIICMVLTFSTRNITLRFDNLANASPKKDNLEPCVKRVENSSLLRWSVSELEYTT